MRIGQSQLCLVSIAAFNGSSENPAKADKNGKMPIYLNTLTGSLPERARVLSGSVAENQGFTVGSVGMIKVERIEDSQEYGEQYRHSLIQKSASLSDTLQATGLLSVVNTQVVEKEAVVVAG